MATISGQDLYHKMFYLVEIIELYTSNSTTNPGCDRFTRISNKIRHREQFGSLFVTLVRSIKVPSKKKENIFSYSSLIKENVIL